MAGARGACLGLRGARRGPRAAPGAGPAAPAARAAPAGARGPAGAAPGYRLGPAHPIRRAGGRGGAGPAAPAPRRGRPGAPPAARGAGRCRAAGEQRSEGPAGSGSAGAWRKQAGWAAAAAGAAGLLVACRGQLEPVLTACAEWGFSAAFSLIFVSELGDKTFFIAAILAMKLGKEVALVGASTALGVMSVISVVIGRLFRQLPSFMDTSLPLGEYLAVALMVLFGCQSLWGALRAGDDQGELRDAEDSLAEETFEAGGGAGTMEAWLRQFWKVFAIIFAAEWGDRSMLATIALGAAQNPVGVAVGATVGHIVATGIAVVGGVLLSKHLSERVVSGVGGVLFLVFAALTVLGVY